MAITASLSRFHNSELASSIGSTATVFSSVALGKGRNHHFIGISEQMTAAKRRVTPVADRDPHFQAPARVTLKSLIKSSIFAATVSGLSGKIRQ
jgi:hypothetical protein